MHYFLGIDTGGTFTDAVLLDDRKNVIAAAKSLTTRFDLAVGIGGALEAQLRLQPLPLIGGMFGCHGACTVQPLSSRI